MPYALVEDVAASWDRYTVIARSLGSMPDGLVLHVAGPTDEGFRIIEIWESEDAWRAFANQFDAALELVDPEVGTRAVARSLRGVHVLLGEAFRDTAAVEWAPGEMEPGSGTTGRE